LRSTSANVLIQGESAAALDEAVECRLAYTEKGKKLLDGQEIRHDSHTTGKVLWLIFLRELVNQGCCTHGSAEVAFCVGWRNLSPLLSNLVLDELDRELKRRNHCFVRYADDCNIYVRSQRAGERVKRRITGFIGRRLKLKVNEAKSAVARPAERKFLGFSMTSGREIKRSIAPKSLARFKQKVRELTVRTRGISIEQMTKELSIYLRGWKGYFGFCQTSSVLKAACEGRLVPTEAELARQEGRAYEPADKLLRRILRERRARW
jgi:hypothetical protein